MMDDSEDVYDSEWDLENVEPTNVQQFRIWRNLFRAIQDECLPELKRLVKSHSVDIQSVQSPFGRTLLVEACHQQSLEMVKYLVEELGVDVNEEASYREERPLLVAATSCDRQILRLLLENGADLDDGYIGYNTVFHNQIYENPEIMRLLVDFGVDINFRNKGNYVIERIENMFYEKNSNDSIKYLFQQGLGLHHKDWNRSWIETATAEDNLDMVRFLFYISGWCMNASDTYNFLKRLVWENSDSIESLWPMIGEIMDHVDVSVRGPQDGKPILHSQYGYYSGNINLDVVKCLVDRGIDIHAVDQANSTPLMAVIGHGDIAGARYFMSLGADPYHYDRNHNTPCFLAIQCGNVGIIKMLVEEFNVKLSEVVKMKYYTTSVRRSELSQERKEYIARRIELEKQEEIANMRRQLDSSDNPDPELAAKLAEYTKPPKKKQRRKHQFY